MRSFGSLKAIGSSFVLSALAIAGLGAAPPSTVAINTPPKLETFTIRSLGYGLYSASGRVSDNYPEGCFVGFGGIMTGYYAAVMEDGSYEVTFESSYGGAAWAEAVDDVGQLSDVLWDSIQ